MGFWARRRAAAALRAAVAFFAFSRAAATLAGDVDWPMSAAAFWRAVGMGRV